MKQLQYVNNVYQTDPKTASFFSKIFSGLLFYLRFFTTVFKASRKAKRGKYDYPEWCVSSFEVLRALEKAGINFEITGIENIKKLDGPCVFIGNHMSMLETVILPIIIQPIRNVTFVVKQSLLEYPVFKHVMRSREPIAVTRTNPRQDLTTVMEQGIDRLKNGVSVIVFPGKTRAFVFKPEEFSTIGVKLAKRANVPIVPLALLTNAWRNGRYIKDLGKIDTTKDVKFAFGKPMIVQNKGAEEHHAVIDFIVRRLQEWERK